jgi:hypothetical protein
MPQGSESEEVVVRLRRWTAITLVATAMLLPSRRAQASDLVTVREFFNYCVTEGVHLCSSMKISTVTSASGTDLVFAFRNEQGTNTFDTSAWSSLTGFYISALGGPYQMGTGPFQGISDTFQSQPLGNVESFGTNPEWVDGHGGSGVDSRYFGYYNTVVGRYIVGCTDEYVPDTWYNGETAGYRTCAKDGLNGWVTSGFSSTGQFTADDLRVEWSLAGYDEAGASTGYGTCVVEAGAMLGGCVGVPEPSTLVLLASGLFGLLGLGIRRRSVSLIAR